MPPRFTALLLALLGANAGATTPAAPQPVQRQGSGWRIDTTGHSLAALAEALAAASGSQLLGSRKALAAMPLRAPVQWHAASLDEAWAGLLDGRVSHARQCSRSQCRIWLAASPAPPAASGAQAKEGRPGLPGLPAPKALSGQPLPPVPAVPVAPPTADPPGLFPSSPA